MVRHATSSPKDENKKHDEEDEDDDDMTKAGFAFPFYSLLYPDT